ncbi:MAG: cytochrome-c peroxidase [Vicingus serpentipes]|nr:cytochrome-c peroxidase [Vicingus serpentipes]
MLASTSPPPPPTNGTATPAQITIPTIFSQLLPPPLIPPNNPLTVEGIELGRRLFFDPILSGDGTQSCATCHAPDIAFTDTNQFSTGIDGLQGNRNSMPIFNVAWNFSQKFFWDGRAPNVEAQAIGPVVNPIEMHNTWPAAMASLQAHPTYPNLFLAAFGTNVIDSILVTKAIAQFERTIVSGNSRFDRYLLGQISLTPSEISGFNVFMTESGGDCFHCHGNSANPLWTDNTFRNNGLDATFTDLGLGAITGNPADNGKFKTPSLRNLVFTAPYMHDGRFATIDEVLEHYSTGVKLSSTIDPDMQFSGQGGVQMTPQEKADLKAFLLALTDSSFINNPAYKAP